MSNNIPLYRSSFRAQLKPDCAPQYLYDVSLSSFNKARQSVDSGVCLTIALYRFGSMLFSYCESIGEEFEPESAFESFSPLLLDWPGEERMRHWVEMRPVYYQQTPENAADWIRSSTPSLHIGRLARLVPSLANEYLYYHHALTEEGLHKGDRYQFISIHENYLFSYYEEPRTNVNIKKLDMPSTVIDAWKNVDPASHFYRFYPNAEDFIHLPSLFIVQYHPSGVFTAAPCDPDR